MEVGGYTVILSPTFDQYLVSKDEGTLIEQSLILIKQPCLFVFETTICINTENSLKYFIRAIFTWGP